MSSQPIVAVSFPAILEVQRGITDLHRRDPRKAAELETWLEDVLAARFHYPSMNPDVARLLARMHCCPPLKNFWFVSQSKETKPGQDLVIAALSIVHRLPIATLDANDYVVINRFFPLPGVYHPVFDTWLVKEGDCDEVMHGLEQVG